LFCVAPLLALLVYAIGAARLSNDATSNEQSNTSGEVNTPLEKEDTPTEEAHAPIQEVAVTKEEGAPKEEAAPKEEVPPIKEELPKEEVHAPIKEELPKEEVHTPIKEEGAPTKDEMAALKDELSSLRKEVAALKEEPPKKETEEKRASFRKLFPIIFAGVVLVGFIVNGIVDCSDKGSKDSNWFWYIVAGALTSVVAYFTLKKALAPASESEHLKRELRYFAFYKLCPIIFANLVFIGFVEWGLQEEVGMGVLLWLAGSAAGVVSYLLLKVLFSYKILHIYYLQKLAGEQKNVLSSDEEAPSNSTSNTQA
jgi:polyhydroxyalkanoate synthesis regulator phasin